MPPAPLPNAAHNRHPCVPKNDVGSGRLSRRAAASARPSAMRDAACCRLATSRCTGGVKTTELACAVWRRVWLAIGQSGGLPPPTPPVSSFLFCPRSDRIFFGKGSSSCRSKARGVAGGGERGPSPRSHSCVARKNGTLAAREVACPDRRPWRPGSPGGQSTVTGRSRWRCCSATPPTAEPTTIYRQP